MKKGSIFMEFFGIAGGFFVFGVLPLVANAATITGTVTTPDAGTLPAVTVQAYTDSNPHAQVMAEAEVGSNGSYSMTISDSGMYYLFAMPDTDSDYSFNEADDAVDLAQVENVTKDLVLTSTQLRGVLYLPDGETGAPGWIAEAHTGDGSVYRAMITDEEGKFNIGGLPEDTQLGLEFRTGPDITGEGYNQPAGYDLNYLSEYEEILELEFSLISAPKRLNFTVLYPEGDGVEQASVGVYPMGDTVRHATGCRTASDGTCSVDISGGEWLIDVNPEYNTSGESSVDWAYFEPGKKVEFVKDEEAESADFEFTVVRTDAWVSGVLLNHDETVPRAADVHVVNKEGNGIWGKINNDTGEFNFPVVAGILVVRAFPLNEQSDDAFPVNQIVVVPEETYDLGTITGLNPQATISGHLRTASGDPIPGKNVTAWDFNNDYHVSNAADSDGKFSFTVYPASWILSVEEDNDYEAVNDLNIEITSEDEVSSGHILEMVRRERIISGSLLDTGGEMLNVENFTPYAIDAQGRAYSGQTGSGSNYSLNVPADGQYEVYLFFDPNSSYLIKDKLVVNVSDKDVTGQDFTILQNSATIFGELRDDEGEAVELRGRIVATNHFGARTVETDETGAYEMDLPKGEWQVTYEILDETNEYLRQTPTPINLTLTAGEEDTQNFTLTPAPYEVAGIITDADGQPLPYAEVFLSNDDTKAANEDLVQLFSTANEDGEFVFYAPSGEYELGGGNHLQSENIAPAKQTVTVSDDVTDRTLVFSEADFILTGETNIDDGFVRIYSEDGQFYLGEIENGEYSLNVAENENLTVEAFALDGEKFYRNIPQTIAVTEDEELDLILYEDAAVDVPTAQVISFSGSQAQIINMGENVSMEIPAYALSDDNVTLLATPTLEVNAHDYDIPVNFSYEFAAKESSGAIITKFNQPVVVNMGFDQQELQTFGIKEKNLQPRFADDNSGLLENTGAAVVDKQENEAVFVTDHFSKFTLATPYSSGWRLLKTRGLTTVQKKSHRATLHWQKVFGTKKYIVRYKKFGTKKWQLATTKRNQLVIKGLQKGGRYRAQVRAVQGKHKGQWSKLISIRLKKN